MFCPFTNMDCVGAKCVMWEKAEPTTDDDGNLIPPEEAENCLKRLAVESEIDFYVGATEVLENGLPGFPPPQEVPTEIPQDQEQVGP